MPNTSQRLRFDELPDILTVKEVASFLRISRNAVYGAVQSGLLPAAKFGERQIRIAKSTLQKAFSLASQHVTGTAAFSRDSGGN